MEGIIMSIKLKEPLAGSIHLIGAILAVPATIILIVFGSSSAWKVVSFSIYGSALFLLFLFSTLYHWLPWSAGGKNQIFRKLDHLAIYSLIAGTYTPFCLITLRGPWGWGIFATIWAMAIFGIVIQSIYINVWRWLTTTIYIVMGWLVIIAAKPLISALPVAGLHWLVAGGIIYSVGGIIYTTKKPNLHTKFGYHELWHILVLLGAACHFVVILFYLAMK
jgi:hemolysin III